MFAYNPSKRITALQSLEHPFLAGHKVDKKTSLSGQLLSTSLLLSKKLPKDSQVFERDSSPDMSSDM